MHEIMYWAIRGTPRAFNAYIKEHVKEAVDNKYETTSFWLPPPLPSGDPLSPLSKQTRKSSGL